MYKKNSKQVNLNFYIKYTLQISFFALLSNRFNNKNEKLETPITFYFTGLKVS